MKKFTIVATSLLLTLTVTSTALAGFKDVKGHWAEKSILNLTEKQVIKGVGKEKFNPKGVLTYAEAVTLINRVFDLNLDHIRFIKEPKASDYFTNVGDNKWYTYGFIVGLHNGIDLPKDIKANDKITREEFAFYVRRVMEVKGNNPPIPKIKITYKDQDKINAKYLNAVMDLSALEVFKGDKGKFHPTKPLNRAEVSIVLDRLMTLLEADLSIPDNIEIKETPLNSIEKEVILTFYAPNPGYTFEIIGVSSEGETTIITYKITAPPEDRYYPTVIDKMGDKAVVPLNNKVKIKEIGNLN